MREGKVSQCFIYFPLLLLLLLFSSSSYLLTRSSESIRVSVSARETSRYRSPRHLTECHCVPTREPKSPLWFLQTSWTSRYRVRLWALRRRQRIEKRDSTCHSRQTQQSTPRRRYSDEYMLDFRMDSKEFGLGNIPWCRLRRIEVEVGQIDQMRERRRNRLWSQGLENHT